MRSGIDKGMVALVMIAVCRGHTNSAKIGPTSRGAITSSGRSVVPETKGTEVEETRNTASRSSAKREANVCARSTFWRTVSSVESILRSASRQELTVMRSALSWSTMSTGRGRLRRVSMCGEKSVRNSAAASNNSVSNLSSSTTLFMAVAKVVAREAEMVTPTVAVSVSSSWCASSKITTSCSGRMAPPLAT